MKLAVVFCRDADIIDCPKNIVDNIIQYKKEFICWLFDKNNNLS
jgi:hypothetical protein